MGFVLVMALAEKGQGSLIVTCTLVTTQCVAGREGKRVCTDPTTYCDTFEDSCKSCISLCEDASQFEDCHLHCKDFLQSLITIHNTKERSDIQTLTIMVAVTAAMTSVGLGSNTSRAASLRAGPSVQTMSTQLSDESQANYGVTYNPNLNVNNNPNYNNNNRRASFNQRTRRAPSEDCVAEDFSGRDGLGRERGQVV